MQPKVDLRYQLGLSLSHANAMLKALQDLPETEDAMMAAALDVSRTERVQTVEYLSLLCQRLYQIREHGLWVKRMLSEGL